jgi:hypothetical protein
MFGNSINFNRHVASGYAGVILTKGFHTGRDMKGESMEIFVSNVTIDTWDPSEFSDYHRKWLLACSTSGRPHPISLYLDTTLPLLRRFNFYLNYLLCSSLLFFHSLHRTPLPPRSRLNSAPRRPSSLR